MIDVDLCSMKPKAISTTLMPPLFFPVKPQPHITETLNPHIQGALAWLQWTSSAPSMPVSQQSIPGRKLPSATLGVPPPTGVEYPLSLEGVDSAMPKLMATSSQALQHMAMPGDILITIPISNSPSLPPVSKTPTVASIPSAPSSEDCPRADPGTLSEEVLQLQREMNAAMGQLLTTRASMDSHQRRLVSNTKSTLHQNEAMTAATIKEAKAHCTATIREAEATSAGHTHTLQQSLGGSMQDLECEAIEKEEQDCQSFLEACGAALQTCPPKPVGYSCTPCSC